MAEEAEKQSRAAPKGGEKKTSSRSSGNAQPSGHASGPRSNTGSSSQRTGDRPQRPRDGPQTSASRPPRAGGTSGQGNRSGGARTGDRPYGSRPQGDRASSAPRQGDRPAGGYRAGAPRTGDRPYGSRPQGDRPGYQKGPEGGPARGPSAEADSDSTEGFGTKAAVRLPSRSADYSRSYRGSSARATTGQRSSPNRQGGRRGGRTGPGSRSKQASSRQPMLSMHKVIPFKYDMNQILLASSMDPAKASGFLATVVAKASRVSVREAKEYVGSFLEAGDVTKEEHDRFCRLLDRYSKYR